MTIATNNELDALLSKAFGENWIERGLLDRSSDELDTIANSAECVVGERLLQLASVGRAIGESGELPDIDRRSLGWLIAGTAECASLFLELAGVAQQMKNPRFREVYAPSTQTRSEVRRQ